MCYFETSVSELVISLVSCIKQISQRKKFHMTWKFIQTFSVYHLCWKILNIIRDTEDSDQFQLGL